MSELEFGPMYSEIEAFLAELNPGPATTAYAAPHALDYWHDRRAICSQDIELLSMLVDSALTLPEICRASGRDTCATAALLEALLAVGVLEWDGIRYRSTTATRLYLHSLRAR